MRTLTAYEVEQVAGGELTCTTANGALCAGVSDPSSGLLAAYDWAVSATTDLIEYLAG